MIALVAVAFGFAFLSFPGLVARPASCSISQWTRASRSALVAGLGLVLGGLLLWGAPLVIHLLDGTGLPGFCDEAVHRLPLGGLTWAAVVLLIAGLAIARLGASVAVAVRRARSARIDPFIGRHRTLGEFDLVVVPSTRLFAHSIPGQSPQIVLSDGLVALLDEQQVSAVVRHEMAHHRLDHRRFLVVAAVVEQLLGWAPPVRRSVTALRANVELWADEASTGSPRRARELSSALQRIGDVDLTTPVRQALGTRISTLLGQERQRLGRAPRHHSPRVAAAVAGLALVTLVFGFMGAGELWSAIGRCAT